MTSSFLARLAGFCLFSHSLVSVADDLTPATTRSFAVPPAGSYVLPPLGRAGDGAVLDSLGQKHRLHDFMRDKPVLLSFIYATCSDARGCPLATKVLHTVSRRLQKDEQLAGRVRILTLSFDSLHDTPERMREYGASLKTGDLDWQFLTTADEASLQPILTAYPQNVEKIYDEAGQFTGTFSHLLRVYLIDTDRKIRNIYSVDFLEPDLLINDLKTLLLPAVQATGPLIPHQAVRLGPGDDRQHYETADYTTHAQSLTQRKGQAAPLLKLAKKPQSGLLAVPVPADNPLTAAKIALGRKLFYDRRLSLNDTVSCALCHIPEQGFANNEMKTAVGIEGRSVRRNTPSLYNVAYAKLLFHDGRENSLEQQVWGPLLAANEMGNPSIGFVIDKLRASPDYRGLFERAFGKGPGMETIGQALASYERSLNAADSAFDRWYFGHQNNALNEAAQRGFRLFTGQAGCSQCHTLDGRSALFTDQQRHNTGVGYADSRPASPAEQKVQVAPGVFVDLAPDVLASLPDTRISDLGYYEISQNPADRWAYKTPTLRNIALTAPYMHNGSLTSLEAVIDFYDQGGMPNENLSPKVKPLGLSTQAKADLLAFLHALTGNVAALVSDAFAAEVGER